MAGKLSTCNNISDDDDDHHDNNNNKKKMKQVRLLLQVLQSRPGHLLPVGFGFRPTDVELVTYFLLRKNDGGSLRPLDQLVVPEVDDVYACDPWDLTGKSLFQSGDLVWHFFSPKNQPKSWSSGLHYSLPTKHGQWVFTGKERDIMASPGSPAIIGRKRTLIFYQHRHVERDDISCVWVIHEYRTREEQEDFVLCRLLKKPVEIRARKASCIGPSALKPDQHHNPLSSEKSISNK